MIYEIFVKHRLLFILGARFFMFLIDVLEVGAQQVHAHDRASNFSSPELVNKYFVELA